jgi:hypothetical protein
MNTEEARAEIIKRGLTPLLEEAHEMIGPGRLRLGTNDVVVCAFVDADGSARLHVVTRGDTLRSMQATLPECTNTLARLSKALPPAEFFLLIAHESEIFCIELQLTSTLGVLN